MKEQSKAKETLLKCAQKVAEREVLNNMSNWWPNCGGIIHQLKRPKESIVLKDKTVGE